MTENANAGTARVELPDDGMTKAQLDKLEINERRRWYLAATAAGRLNWQTHGIDPLKPTSAAAGGSSAGGGAPPPFVFGDSFTSSAQPLPKTIIMWNTHSYVRLSAKIALARALAANAPRLYKRGKMLSVMAFPEDIGEEPDPEKENTTTTVDISLQRVRLADFDDLKNQCDEANIQFVGGAKQSPIHPPKEPMIALIKDPQLCPARSILGVTRTPYMDYAGNIDMTSGYNPRTKTLQDLSQLGAFNVPEKPSKADVDAAVATIMHPFSLYDNYTKRDEAGRIQWTGEILTLALTAINRPYLDKAPLLMVAGVTSGAGKGELCTAMVQLAFNTHGDIIVMGIENEEFVKRVDSVIMGGAPTFTIDNLNYHLFVNDTLASFATEGYQTIRPFGKLGRDVQIEGRPLILINGNMLTASQDNNRRTFRVEVYTVSSTPFDRVFKFYPAEETRRTRTAMLAALYTLMRWWRQRGMTDAKAPRVAVGSFPQWGREIADLVASLTGWHPGQSIKDNLNIDRHRENTVTVIDCLIARFGLNRIFTAADVDEVYQRVMKIRRDGEPYTVFQPNVNRAVFPALAEAERLEKVIPPAIEQLQALIAGHTGSAQQLQELKRDLGILQDGLKKAVVDRTNELAAAAIAQARIESDLAYAIRDAVTLDGGAKGKYTSTNAIGMWFMNNSKKPIGDKIICREKAAGQRAADIWIRLV